MKHTSKSFVLLALAVGMGCVACGGEPGWHLQSVAALDLQRYSGTWYEIASYPQLFQLGCTHTQARYVLNEDSSSVNVTNTCLRHGRPSSIRGTAEVPNQREPGHLVVHLRTPLVGDSRGDYYVLRVDAGYQWALVGHPSRDALWVLSRKTSLPDALLDGLVQAAEQEFGYDDVRQRLRCTRHETADLASCRDAVVGRRH